MLEVCPAHKDKVEIKCMGSIGGKHQQNQNFIYSFLSLGTLNKIKLMLCALFKYNKSDNTTRNIHFYDENFNDESETIIKIAFYDQNFGFVIDHCDEPRTSTYL